jgi:hypothetical protein
MRTKGVGKPLLEGFMHVAKDHRVDPAYLCLRVEMLHVVTRATVWADNFHLGKISNSGLHGLRDGQANFEIPGITPFVGTLSSD